MQQLSAAELIGQTYGFGIGTALAALLLALVWRSGGTDRRPRFLFAACILIANGSGFAKNLALELGVSPQSALVGQIRSFGFMAAAMLPLSIVIIWRNNAVSKVRRKIGDVLVVYATSSGLLIAAGLALGTIQMPGLSGFDVLKGLSKDTPRPLTIFVTGFHEHALEAFRARAIAYLLKPIEEDHLREMIERAFRLLASIPSREEEDQNVSRLLGDELPVMEQIVARKANRVFLLDPAEALVFYMDGGIVRVRVDNDTYWVNYQLGELEQALASRGFFRARRSSLVNLKRVKEIRSDPRSSFVLVMSDARNTEVEVSERQGRALRTRIPGL